MPHSRGLAMIALLAVPALAQASSYVHVPSAPGAASRLVWDSARGRVVAIESTPEPRLWDWDGTAWSLRLGVPGPGSAVPHGAVYDPHRRLVLAVANNEIREFDVARWTVRSTTVPVPSTWYAYAFDIVRRRLVAPNGTTVREWDGASWNVLSPLHAPGYRTRPAFAYHPVQQRCILYGGSFTSSGGDECWAWDGTDWTLLDGNAPPGPRDGGSLAYEPTSGRLILYGGYPGGPTTWALTTSASSGSTWTQVATSRDPGLRYAAQMVWDGQGLLLLGGNTERGGELWRFANDDWHELTGGNPVSRRHAGLTWDPARGQAVLFGGHTVNQPLTTFGDTWTFDGRWHRYDGVGPAPRQRPNLAWSSADNALLLFGGFPTMTDTWNWTGTAWVQRTPAHSPSPRDETTLVADPQGGVLLFGGSSGTTLFGDQWHWNGVDWQQQMPSPLPSPRAGVLTALDPVRNVVVLAGGYASTPMPFGTGTWEWNGASWTQHPVSPFGQGSTGNERICFHPDTARVRIESYTQSEWDGSGWSPVQPPFPGDEGARLATDPLRGRVIGFPMVNGGLGMLTRTPGGAARFGNGCAIGPAPAITALGRPVPGASGFALAVAALAPQAPLFLGVGLVPANQSLGSGCSVLIAQVLGVTFTVADGNGELLLPIAIPADLALRGVTFVAQAAVVDPPRGLFGALTLSDGLRVTIGD